MSNNVAFISYSHDSDTHRERVLGLSERLRTDGIETILDRYVERGSPAEGWPRWMLNGLNNATHVLCVCTETYYRRFRGLEIPEKGKGVDWEGSLMTQALYETRSVSNKFLPVLFDQNDEIHIPEPLRGQTHYVLESEPEYQFLYDVLVNQSGIEPGIVGELKRRPRNTGQPISFNDQTPVEANAAHLVPSHALAVWHKKLEFYLIEEAVCMDPEMKFRIRHLIREAQEKISLLGS